MDQTRKHLLAIFQAAIDSVSGQRVVCDELLAGDYPDTFHVVAIGKAADAMLQGIGVDRIKSALLVSKQGHVSEKLKREKKIQSIESSHPFPTQASLNAGKSLIDYLQNLPKNEPCLFLISGGASALVEVLEEGWNLQQLHALNDYLLSRDFTIDEINAVRRSISKVKGGRLWNYLGNRSVYCLLISDVPDNDPAVIGSGLLFASSKNKLPKLSEKWSLLIADGSNIKHLDKIDTPKNFVWKIVASLDDAKEAAEKKAKELGYQTKIIDEFLEGGAEEAAIHCVKTLHDYPNTLIIWGGETTVNLPENAGKGGRSQHLALKAAIEMSLLDLKHENKKMNLLVAGTDGSDGVTNATGALADNQTVAAAKEKYNLNVQDFLQRADSYHYFKRTDELIITGATGTNVMDLVLGVYRH